MPQRPRTNPREYLHQTQWRKAVPGVRFRYAKALLGKKGGGLMSKMAELHADLERAAVLTARQAPSTATLLLTRFEQIAAAFPLHAQRIAEATHAFDPKGSDGWLHSEPEQHGARWALYDAFDWSQTVEGARYWYALAEGART
jgi:hypothetical protein